MSTTVIGRGQSGLQTMEATTPIDSRSADSNDIQKTPLSACTSALYRLHGFRVVDAQGKPAGAVDWIWTDGTDKRGEFLGVRLHWLLGTARAIPAAGGLVDMRSRTITVPHTVRQIRRADRLKIDRALTAREKRRICFHYRVEPRATQSRERSPHFASAV